MTNRINGDFDQDSIEAFRAAYANQILSPEEQEVDQRTGLPTNLVLNTSPWIQHTGLWKANDGTDKNFVPNQVLVPGESEDEEDELVLESEDEDLDEEEIEELLEEILDELEAEEIEETLELLRSGNFFDEDGDGEEEVEYESDLEGEELSDEEIDAIIAELEGELEG